MATNGKFGGEKTGGRKVGTPNRATKDIREAFKKLVEDNIDNFDKWIKNVAMEDPNKAMQLILDVSERILPKLKSVEASIENKGEIKITIKRGDRITTTTTTSSSGESAEGGEAI